MKPDRSEQLIEIAGTVNHTQYHDAVRFGLIEHKMIAESLDSPKSYSAQLSPHSPDHWSKSRLSGQFRDRFFDGIDKSQCQICILRFGQPRRDSPNVLDRKRGSKNFHDPKRLRMLFRMSSKSSGRHSDVGEARPSASLVSKSDFPTRFPNNLKAASSTSAGVAKSPPSIQWRTALS